MQLQNQVQAPKAKRVESLDAFRGICSFLIMLTHFILYIPGVFKVENLGWIYGGLSWKLPYFFVLSGFVLTLSYRRSKERSLHPYRDFLITRVMRIYPLFIITTIVMFLLANLFGGGCELDGVSQFFNISWRQDHSVGSLLHSLALVGIGNTWAFNGPAWTLVFEMRYALIFPLFVWLLRKHWSFILLFVVMSAVANHMDSMLERVDIFYAVKNAVSNSYSMICFLLYYVGGVLLALNREKLSTLYLKHSRRGRVSLFVLMIILSLVPTWCRYVIPAVAQSIFKDVVILIAVVMFIVMLLNNEKISAIFSHRWLVALGRSSFSLYLWHTPIMALNILLFRDDMSWWALVAMSVVEAVVVAQLSFRFVETPFIKLSHRLIGRK